MGVEIHLALEGSRIKVSKAEADSEWAHSERRGLDTCSTTFNIHVAFVKYLSAIAQKRRAGQALLSWQGMCKVMHTMENTGQGIQLSEHTVCPLSLASDSSHHTSFLWDLSGEDWLPEKATYLCRKQINRKLLNRAGRPWWGQQPSARTGLSKCWGWWPRLRRQT